MPHTDLYRDILAELEQQPVVDVHSHLQWHAPQARSLAHLVFYHFVTYELCSAGMPREALRQEDDEARLRAALPYLPKIRFGGTWYCLKRILQDLFGMQEDMLTEDNLDALRDRVAATAEDAAWPQEVLKERTRIETTFVSIDAVPKWPEAMAANDPDYTRYNDLFVPAVETSLLGSHLGPRYIEYCRRKGRPVPPNAKAFANAVWHKFTPDHWDQVRALLGWATLDLRYSDADETEADKAYEKMVGGNELLPEEANALRIYALSQLLERCRAHAIPCQIFFGSEHTAGRATVSAYDAAIMREVAQIMAAHRDIEFGLLIGSETLSQEAAILTKMQPNLHLAGIWWHNMYPSFIRRVLAARLDICPANRVAGFFSDAYMVEWGYGKWMLVQRELAHLLAERVDRGYITRNDATEVARLWLWDNPRAIYGLDGSPTSCSAA